MFINQMGNNFRFGLELPKQIICQFSQLLLILNGYHFKIHYCILKQQNKKQATVRRNVKMWQIQLYIENKHMRKTYFNFLFLCRNREFKNGLKYSSDLCNSGSRNAQSHTVEVIRLRHSLKSNGARRYCKKHANKSTVLNLEHAYMTS